MPDELALFLQTARVERPRPLLPLAVRGLTYRVGTNTIIDAADFDIEAGGCTVIMGYNGAGKSVLLRLLHGLIRPSEGRIEWANQLSRAQHRRRQAMVFQHPVVLGRSVRDNIAYAVRAHDLDLAAVEPQVEALLAAAGIAHLADRDARVLSGGERQRLAVVRALVLQPEVLFMDEPTSSLDPNSARAVEALIVDARDNGTKVVLVTQNLPQARRLARDVIFLHRGRVLEQRPAEMFFSNPESTAAEAFVKGEWIN